MKTTTQLQTVAFWLIRILPALILLQTLFFKFSASAESVYIFETVGIEPWGRILTGCVELVAAVLLMIPRFSFYGAGLAAGTMLGAIASHFTILGIEVMGDGGLLFFYALTVFVFCSIILVLERQKINELLKLIVGSKS
jgi:uncharacterized membrane protein YphA (DoxX/SURF4 family)